MWINFVNQCLIYVPPAVTLRDTQFDHTVYLRVSYDKHNKLLFPYTYSAYIYPFYLTYIASTLPLKGFGDFKIGQVIRTVKYADDLVLLDTEETVLQCMMDKLI
jgi:hypothetical protein